MSKKVYIPLLDRLVSQWHRLSAWRHRSSAPTWVIDQLLADRLLERLDGLKLTPEKILDVSHGSPHSPLALKQRFGQAQVWVLDPLKPIDKKLVRKNARGIHVLGGDLFNAAIEPHSLDLIVASAAFRPHDDPSVVLQAYRTLLKPKGFLLLSTLGSDTLRPEQALLNSAMFQGMDAQGLGSILTRAGFNEPVIDTDWITMHYESADPLWSDLETLGWLETLDDHTQKNLRSHIQSLDLPVERLFECLWASAFAPDEGQTLMGLVGEGTVAMIGVDQIGRRHRG